MKNTILGALGGCLGRILEALGGVLEACGAVLEALGGVLEALESVLEALDVVLEAMLGQDSSKQAHESENLQKHKENQGFLVSRPSNFEAKFNEKRPKTDQNSSKNLVSILI